MSGLTKPLFQARQHLLVHMPDFPLATTGSPNGRCFACACADGSIHLYFMDAPEKHCSWQAHESPIQQLAWHPLEPMLCSAAQDGSVKYWLVDGDKAELHASVPVSAEWIEAMAWRPDGRYLAVAAGKKAYVFDRQRKLVNTLDFGSSTIAALDWSPRGTELALAGYKGIQLFSGVASKPQRTTLFWQGSLLTCCWSPDGKVIAACCQDNAVHFWRVKSKQDAQMSGYPGKPRSLAFSADSRYLVTGGSATIATWVFSDGGPEGQPPVELAYHRAHVTALCLEASSGHLAAGSKDGVVSLWESPVASVPYYHFAMSAALAALHWLRHDGKQLLVACDEAGMLGIWELYIG